MGQFSKPLRAMQIVLVLGADGSKWNFICAAQSKTVAAISDKEVTSLYYLVVVVDLEWDVDSWSKYL